MFRTVFVPLVPILMLCAAPVWAEPPEQRWALFAEGAGLSPTSSEVSAGSERGRRFDVGSGAGLGLGLRYRWSEHWGLKLSVRLVDLDTELRTSAEGGLARSTDTMEFELYSLGTTYSFLQRDRFDVFAEASVVMSKGSDQIFTTTGGESVKLTFDDDIGFELGVGSEIRLGGDESRWHLRLGVGYLTTILETDSGFADVDLDPVTVSVGVGFSF